MNECEGGVLGGQRKGLGPGGGRYSRFCPELGVCRGSPGTWAGCLFPPYLMSACGLQPVCR